MLELEERGSASEMSKWRGMVDGGTGGAVVMVAVDASKEMTDYALDWAIRNVVRPKDALILVALLKQKKSAGKLQPQGTASVVSDGSKFLGLWRKKFSRHKASVKDKDNDNSSTDSSNEHPRRGLGFEDEGVKWIYEVCLDMLSNLCSENDTEQVKAQVKVVPCSNLSSVANMAQEHRADWVILERCLKKETECCMRRLNCNIVRANNALPRLLKMVNEKERQEESDKTDLLSLLTSIDESSYVTTSMNSSNSNISRSSTSISEEGSIATPLSMSAEIFASQNHSSMENQQRRTSPLPLPPGRQFLDDVSRFKMRNPEEGIAKGRFSVDSAMKPRNETKFKYTDTGTNKTSAGTQESLTQNSFEDESETIPITEAREFEESGICFSTEPKSDLSSSASRRLDRTSSVRKAMSMPIKNPQTPPPLCSVCKHNAPIFGKPPRKFSYKDMEIATDGFSRENFLAEGGYGPVYRGVLEDGQVVAVKKHKEASAQGAKEFCSELDVLSCAQHKNLVMLVGYCLENNEWLLVYEFACNGSLDKHLHGNGKEVMAWKHRQKAAIGTARGLRYLHEDCRVGCIVHRDLRPNNILLTHDFEAMVGDFGLARLQIDGRLAEETRIVGTLGYLAPEYTQTGQITEKADVYSFGVLIMELITGMKAIDLIRRGMYLRDWATPLIENMDVHKLIDPRLKGRYDKQEVKRMMNVAGLCVSPEPETRPRMAKVLRLLEGDMDSDRASRQLKQVSDNMSHRLSKMFNPISRSANGAGHSRSLTPPTSRSINEDEFDRRSKTPPPPSRFSDNPTRLRHRKLISKPKLSDSASPQQYQTPSTTTNRESTSRLGSKTLPLMSRPTTYIPSHVRSSSPREGTELTMDTYNLHAEEDSIMKPTPWSYVVAQETKDTYNLHAEESNIMKPTLWSYVAVQETEEVSNIRSLNQDDLTSREYQAYLQDSFYQFIRNTK